VTDLVFFLGAVLLAVAGGEAFLKSILGAAIHLRVPKMVVATSRTGLAGPSPLEESLRSYGWRINDLH
jgi:hypothetical protein